MTTSHKTKWRIDSDSYWRNKHDVLQASYLKEHEALSNAQKEIQWLKEINKKLSELAENIIDEVM